MGDENKTLEDPEVQNLMRFYGVDTLKQLILRQDSHITNLQGRLGKLSPIPSMSPISPRQG